MTPRDSRDGQPARRRQKGSPYPSPATRDQSRATETLSRGDRDERPSQQANESRYGAAPTAVPPSQGAGWTPGSNYAVHLVLTRTDLAAITPEQREQLVAVLTSMILDFLQRQRTEQPRPV